MARKEKEVKWEDVYVDKLAFLKELYEERRAFLKSSAQTDAGLSSGDGAAAGLTAGSNNAEKAWNFFANKGFTAVGAAAILGNLQQESRIETDLVNSIGASGICQWMGGRLAKLKQEANNKGVPWTDIDLQLNFLFVELTTEATAVSIFNKRYGGFEKAVKNATDLKSAVIAFEVAFERAGKNEKMYDKRIKYANDYLTKFGSGGGAAQAVSITGDATGKAKLVLELANEWLSKPNRYVLGGGRSKADIAAGKFDCSSWVRYIFEQAGINIGSLGGTTTKTLIKLGKSVSTSELQPGDLAFFDSYGAPPGHVTIYIGGGKCIGSQVDGISVFNMHGTYWKDVIHKEHRRVIT